MGGPIGIHGQSRSSREHPRQSALRTAVRRAGGQRPGSRPRDANGPCERLAGRCAEKRGVRGERRRRVGLRDEDRSGERHGRQRDDDGDGDNEARTGGAARPAESAADTPARRCAARSTGRSRGGTRSRRRRPGTPSMCPTTSTRSTRGARGRNTLPGVRARRADRARRAQALPVPATHGATRERARDVAPRGASAQRRPRRVGRDDAADRTRDRHRGTGRRRAPPGRGVPRR